MLNWVGWSALLGAGMVSGILIAALTPIPTAICLILGVGDAWLFALVLDRRRFLNSMVHLCRDDLSPEIGATIVTELSRMGIEASYEELDDRDEREPEGGDGIQRGIRCRQADAAAVSDLLYADLGR